MPRRSRDQVQANLERLRALLTRRGPMSRLELQKELGLSHPTVLRLLALDAQIERLGGYRDGVYALGDGSRWPVFEIDEEGLPHELGELRFLFPSKFAFREVVFDDLPYFLHDLRPTGFLGRRVPRKHPELALPEDIRLWSSATTLRYLEHAGFDMPGNLVVGERAASRLLLNAEASARVPRYHYPRMANDALTWGLPGSFAGGEQSKFLSMSETGRWLLVKFSGPTDERVGRRVADILVSEHLAQSLLLAHGLAAAKTEVVEAEGRLFLEVERFDRVGERGRRGVLSLGALASERVGLAETWREAGAALRKGGVIPQAWEDHMRTVQIFGELIANSDMHLYNFSFLTRNGIEILGPTPVYDMCPMLYAPRALQVVAAAFTPPVPRRDDLPLWRRVFPIAETFWEAVAADGRVSEEFRQVAAANQATLRKLAPLIMSL